MNYRIPRDLLSSREDEGISGHKSLCVCVCIQDTGGSWVVGLGEDARTRNNRSLFTF